VGVGSARMKSPFLMGWVQFIRRGWEEFSRFSRFKVGDGCKISFWHDVW